MSAIEGVSPIASGNSSIVILGTMPSETSLRKQEYYGHSRNAFWSIMSMLYGFNHELDYRGRKEMLMENGVAVH
jgi:hypoxanthine-DNA glycosylase